MALASTNIDKYVPASGAGGTVSNHLDLPVGREYAIHFTSPAAFAAVLQRLDRIGDPQDIYDHNDALAEFDDSTAQRKWLVVPGGKYCFRIVSGADVITMWADEV